jgi:hypothetical protein
MKIRDIMEDASVSATGSGDVAVLSQPMGMQRRTTENVPGGKYTTEQPKVNQSARRQFKNSISN